MTRKAVSITTYERQQIQNKVRKRYEKLCQAQHPNPTFHENISKELYLDSTKQLAPHLNEKSAKHILWAHKNSVIRDFSNAKIFDTYGTQVKILSLDVKNNDLIQYEHTPEQFEMNFEELPDIYKQVDIATHKFPMTFTPLGISAYDTKLILSDDQVQRIEEFNTKMETVYGTLQDQLRVLLSTIESCKSTKMFEAKLPDLVSLYPKSVIRKFEDKNGTDDTNLSEEERALRAATASLAAASLITEE